MQGGSLMTGPKPSGSSFSTQGPAIGNNSFIARARHGSIQRPNARLRGHISEGRLPSPSRCGPSASPFSSAYTASHRRISGSGTTQSACHGNDRWFITRPVITNSLRKVHRFSNRTRWPINYGTRNRRNACNRRSASFRMSPRT